MSLVTKIVIVTQAVSVTVDKAKFTPEFMAEFKASMYDFTSLDDHIQHLAQLHARGIDGDFIEGYGEATGMGISFDVVAVDMEIDAQ